MFHCIKTAGYCDSITVLALYRLNIFSACGKNSAYSWVFVKNQLKL